MNYKDWMKHFYHANADEMYNLFRAVDEIATYGTFTCTKKQISSGNQYFVKCSYLKEGLVLNSDQAYQQFLGYLNNAVG